MIAAASAAAHVAVLALLAMHGPKFSMQAAPPTVFDVTVEPRYVIEDQVRPEPTRPLLKRPLAPRRLVRPDEQLSVAPLVTSTAPGPAAAGPVDPRLTNPAALPNSLRRSAVGCANPALLDKAERDACLERLGKGAKDEPFIEPPMSPDKRRAFEEASAKKEAYRKYKEGNLPPGVTTKDGGPQMNALPPIWPPPR